MNVLGVELGERDGDEGVFENVRIGNAARPDLQYFAIEKRDVDVDRARRVFIVGIANAPQPVLDLLDGLLPQPMR